MTITCPDFDKAFELKEKLTIKEAKDYIKEQMLSIGYTVEITDSIYYKTFIHRWLDIGTVCETPIDYTDCLYMISPDGSKRFNFNNIVGISLTLRDIDYNPMNFLSNSHIITLDISSYNLHNSDNFRTFVNKYMNKNFKTLINYYKREQNI